MKRVVMACAAISVLLILFACAASSTSPVGVNCDYRPGKLLWEMPLVCQGR